jgi:ATP-dependent DNA helicase RecG
MKSKTKPIENQNVEWKESWRDDYLKWICGFANAQGGKLELGRSDKGVLVGLPDAKRLLEDLPNKIRTTMGIVADVNLRRKDGFEYIVIDIAPYSNAISYRGKYYLRSGSTNQELTSFALDELILRKYGRTWDSAPVPRVNINDFYNDAFDIFRKKAVSSRRLTPEDVAVSNEQLLKILRLTEGDYLLKSALMLFHQDTEQWCFGSYVKIGYFENDADLLYQDEIGGSLIGIADRVMDTIYTKYLKGIIRYEGIQRIDHYPIPQNVLREAVLNAIVHKDYSTGNPIHIKIYDDKIVIYNDCRLPSNTLPENLLNGIGSRPHNPLIAGTFFRSGQIEAWGRGIEKMKNDCIKDALPEPEFNILPNMFSICFLIHKDNSQNYNNDPINENSYNIKGTENQLLMLNNIAKNPRITITELASIVGISASKIKKNIAKLKEKGLIERIGADKGGYWKLCNDPINDPTNDPINENSDNIKGTENQQLILTNIAQNPYITINELASIVGISASKIKENIAKLKDKGLIERIGADKGGYWKLRQ